MRYGVVAGISGVILALATATVAHAEDDDTPQPGISGGPSTIDRREASPPEIDPLVDLASHRGNDSRVGAILAAHPDRDVLLCLAGCGDGGPKVVSIRSRVSESAAGTSALGVDQTSDRPLVMQLSSAEIPARQKPAPEQGRQTIQDQPEVGDVICLAGCIGKPGEVVQASVRLTWIDRSASKELRSALRGLADRLIAQEAEAAAAAALTGTDGRHAWMSDTARRMLVEKPLPSALAALVRSASALADNSPLRSP